jgi:hypothetical protein
MNEAQTLSYTRAQTATRLRIYQVLFAISIIAGLLAGFMVHLSTRWASPAGVPDRSVSANVAADLGATLFGLQLAYIPGVRNPSFYRWPNWASIAIKFLMTIIFLTAGSSFYLLAAVELVWFVILLVAYYRLMLAGIHGDP